VRTQRFRGLAAWNGEIGADTRIVPSTRHLFAPPFNNVELRRAVLGALNQTDYAPGVMNARYSAGVNARYFDIDSEYRHLASGLDAAKWAASLRSFYLAERED